MKKFFLSAVAVLLVSSPLFAGKVNDRVVSSALVLREIARAPDKGSLLPKPRGFRSLNLNTP